MQDPPGQRWQSHRSRCFGPLRAGPLFAALVLFLGCNALSEGGDAQRRDAHPPVVAEDGGAHPASSAGREDPGVSELPLGVPGMAAEADHFTARVAEVVCMGSVTCCRLAGGVADVEACRAAVEQRLREWLPAMDVAGYS